MKVQDYQVIFSDIDGTLLNQDHRMMPLTIEALRRWTKRGRLLLLCSSRPPMGITPIIRRYQLDCGMIALGGALILGHQGETLFEHGMESSEVKEVIAFLEERKLDVTWNLYTASRWIVKDDQDLRVKREEEIIEAKSEKNTLESLSESERVGKILCMCAPGTIYEVERVLKGRFPHLSIAKSSNLLLEVNPQGVTKAAAIQRYCKQKDIDLEKTIGFGDNYNDLPMLRRVGLPILMGNAPQEIQGMFSSHTEDFNHDGIGKALFRMYPDGF